MTLVILVFDRSHYWILNYFAGCRCGRFPPVVRTAVPVDGRFEHIVLSCNATSDHAIIWIERESQHALDVSLYITSPIVFGSLNVCFKALYQ